jgi:hypothetical protein
MSSTGTFGINSDNFNISGNTNINNLVVSGTTSFPSNSISGNAISSSVANATNASQVYEGYDNTTSTETYALLFSTKSSASGNNAVYQGNAFYTPSTNLINANVANATIATTSTNSQITGGNVQPATFYIPFVNNANASGGYPLKTASTISFIPSTGILSVGGGITLPTSTTPYTATTYATGTMGTASGNLGCVISGAIATTYSSVAVATPSTLSSITLSPGVWMITASISATASTSGAGLFLCISTAGSTAFNKYASSVSVASTTNAGGSISTVISTTTASPVYNFLCYSSAGTGSSVVGQFYAMRIA